jgi:hypothetical protein
MNETGNNQILDKEIGCTLLLDGSPIQKISGSFGYRRTWAFQQSR